MYSMTYFGKFFSNFRDFYNEINASTLTGAIDVIVVEQPDGTYTCSPFHVRFGKIGVLRSREKVVDIEINGTPLDLHMKLGESGEAFFVEKVNPGELGDDEVIPFHLACSPIPGDEDSYDIFEKSFIASKEEDDILVEEIFNPDVDSETSQANFGIEERPPETNLMEANDLQRGILDKDNDSQIQPKTFRAESSEKKVSEIVRKVSSVTGEFRPIDMEPPLFEDEGTIAEPSDPLETGATSNRPTSNAESQFEVDQVRRPSTSKDTNNVQFVDRDNPLDINESGMKEGLNNDKRRRRKKSFLKKKSEMRTKKEETRPSRTGSSGRDNVPNGLNQTTENLFKIDDAVLDVKNQPDINQVVLLSDLEAIDSSSNVDHSMELAGLKRASIDPDFHFFSDTEATPGCSSQRDHRCTPVQSDSEVEKLCHDVDEGRSWRWGELPTPPQHKVPVTDSDTEMAMGRLTIQEEAAAKEGTTEAQRSMLTSMFSFMRKKHMRQHPADEGIYLCDINPEELDPEVAALYFPKSYHQGFVETGHTHDVEPIMRPDEEPFRKDDPHDNESGCGVSLPHSPTSEAGKSGTSECATSGTSSDSRPEVLKDIAMSLCGGLADGGPKDSVFLQKLVLYEDFVRNPKVVDDPNLVVRFNGKYYNWKMACPLVMSVVSYRKTLPQNAVDVLAAEYMPRLTLKEDKPVEARRSSWWSYSWRKVEPKQKADGTGPNESLTVNEEEGKEDNTEALGEPSEIQAEVMQLTNVSEDGKSDTTDSEGRDRFRKTLRLSSDQIAGLNLTAGQNEVEFSVTSAYQGTSRCRCHIYKWRWDDKIVISDIDGTITKSDVLGHILPIVGKDWAQSGVAQLFNKIMNNGYKLLYLSARAIGQARSTRDYLRSIRQEDLNLPDGPLLLSPTGLLSALHREVIEKKPEEFKISCLRDIQALFPVDSKPFYAGYGNKVNDVWAYRAVGIPMFRIFTINHRGELRHEFSQTFQSSYSNMSYLVDQMFPPASTATSDDDFSNFNYWREPIEDVTIEPPSDVVTKPN